jgi:hypothetical protein
MADPISAGVVGSVIPGLANPITGALTAGLTTAATAGSTSPFSMGSILNGIGTNFAAGGDVGKGLAMNAAALAGSGGGYGAGGESLFGFEGPGTAIGRFIDPVISTIGNANDWMNKNQMATQLGMRTVSSLMQPDQPIPYAPQGQIRQGQVQPMDYMSLLNPQQSTVIRPQPISLI